MSKLSHFDDAGKAAMVDISEKEVTSRIAVAKGEIRMSPDTLKMIAEGTAEKGDVLGIARIAGIQAALEIADSGHQVYLVEREPSIGGHMAQFDAFKVFWGRWAEG